MTEFRPPPPKPPAPSVRSPKGRPQPPASPGGASPRVNPKSNSLSVTQELQIDRRLMRRSEGVAPCER